MESLHPSTRILKVYIEAITEGSGVYSGGLNWVQSCSLNTFLSQGCILGAAAESRKGKQNARSEDRGGGEGPPIAWVQRVGQLMVTSS